MFGREMMVYRTRVCRVGTDADIKLPPDLVSRLGFEEGDLIRLSVAKEGEDPTRLIAEPVASAQERTVIKDRYRGCYSGAPCIAWPLPAQEIPEASQGDDSAAADFWRGASHLCGRGATEEGALANLECLLAQHRHELAVAVGEIDAPEPDSSSDAAVRKIIEGDPGACVRDSLGMSGGTIGHRRRQFDWALRIELARPRLPIRKTLHGSFKEQALRWGAGRGYCRALGRDGDGGAQEDD